MSSTVPGRVGIGARVRLAAAVRTLPVGPGDEGIVLQVLGRFDRGAMLALDVDGSPLPVVVFEDEVEVVPPPEPGVLDPDLAEALARAFDESEVGLALLDADARYRVVSPALARMNARAAEAHLGRTPTEILGEAGEAPEALVRRVAETGHGVVEPLSEIVLPDGTRRAFATAWHPVRDDAGRVSGVCVLVAERTAERAAARLRDAALGRARRIAEQQKRLHSLAMALADAETPADVAARFAERAVGPIGGVAGGVYLAAGDHLERIAEERRGESPVDRAAFARIALGSGTPASAAFATRDPVWLECAADWEAYDDATRAAGAEIGWQACAVLPLVVQGRSVGVAFVNFEPGRHLGDDERTFLRTAVATCAQAIERARLLVAERRARLALERSQTRFQRLVDSGAVGVLRTGGRTLDDANGWLLDLLGLTEGDLGTFEVAALTAPGWEDADARAWEELRATGACRPYAKELQRSDGGRVPVLIAGAVVSTEPLEVLGVVLDRTERDRLAGRADAARAEAEALSRSLQENLLPAVPRRLGGRELRALCRPGDRRLALGGDLYDAIATPDGRVALLIGDVAGHGPEAAALGAAIRLGWRALVLGGTPPARILPLLQELVEGERDEPDRFATVCAAWLDDGDGTVDVACAGHLPPLLLDGGTASVLGVPPGPPLGIGARDAWRLATVRLPADAALLLYTDGVIEGRAAPDSPDRYGVEGLIAALAGRDAAGPALLPDALAASVAANGGGIADDVALLLAAPAG